MKKYGIVVFALLSCLFLATGCSLGNGGIEKKGSLTSFTYRFHRYSGEDTEYRVEKKGGKVFFYAAGPKEAADCQVDESVLNELDARIRDYYLTQWNGFEESNESILGGDSFSLEAVYDSGYRIEARGYEKYPEDFEEVHGAITEYFGEMIRHINGEEPESIF